MSRRADIQRAYRARVRDGLLRVSVVIDDVAVPAALVDAGLLVAGDEDDPKAIAAAIERLLKAVTGNATTLGNVVLSDLYSTRSGRR